MSKFNALGMTDPKTRLRAYLGFALGQLLEKQAGRGQKMIERMLESPVQQIRTGAAHALIRLRRHHDSADIALLQKALSATDPAVSSISIEALRTWRDISFREAVTLLLSVELAESEEILENVASVLSHRFQADIHEIRLEEVENLLNHMKKVPCLEGYWTGELLKRLSQLHGLAVAKFILDRLDISLSKEKDKNYSAVGFERGWDGFELEKSPEIFAIFEDIWLWLRRHDGVGIYEYNLIGPAISIMLKLDTPPVVEFFNAMLDRATAGDLEWIARILRYAPHKFAITQRGFVERYINRCKTVESRLVEIAINQIGAAAMSGIWSGTVGKPTQRDTNARDEAAKILESLSRLSPAYPLYRKISENAKQNIERSLAELAAFEEVGVE